MPVPNEEEQGAAAAVEKPEVDIFGDNEDPEMQGNGQPDADDEEEGADDKDKGDDADKDKKKGGDEDENPTVAALKEANRVKDDSIRAMRKRIKDLEKGGGDKKKAEVDLPYKDIKFSKDLSEDERDSMTETEIKQMDAIAEMQQRINNDVQTAHEKEVGKDDDDDDWDDDDDDGETLDKGSAKKLARSEALKLAKGDKSVANEILQEYNQFNNEGLTPAKVKERLEKANKLRPDYQPPKEQKKKNGKAAKGGGSGDPFGVDQVVEEAAGGDDKKAFDL